MHQTGLAVYDRILLRNPMTRPLLAESAFHPAIFQRIAEHHLPLIQQVQNAMAQQLAMVFVPGTLVGGADDLRRLIDSGELQPLRPA